MDFDQYSTSYRDQVKQSIDFSGLDPSFFVQFRADILLELANQHVGDAKKLKLLDVGCGVGQLEEYIAPKFDKIFGIDPSAQCIEQAQAKQLGVTFEPYPGDKLPFENNSFDLVIAVGVMHHVPVPQWPQFMGELARVVNEDGLVVIFEHNPYNPLTQYVVNRCEIDDDATLLSSRTISRLGRDAGLTRVTKKSFLFFPWQNKICKWMDRRLGWIPMGAQHFVAFKRG